MADETPQIPMPLPTSQYESYVMTMLAQHKTSFDNFRQELLGNGQPGRIQRIETSVVALDEKTSKTFETVFSRQSDTNKRVWSFSGGLAVLGAVATLLGKYWPHH